ncbi:unnamed protein product [Lathyrus oleraceus]
MMGVPVVLDEGVELRHYFGSSSKSEEMHHKQIEELIDQRFEERLEKERVIMQKNVTWDVIRVRASPLYRNK